MKEKSINDSVDRKIIESLKDGFALSLIQMDLSYRIKNFTSVFIRDGVDISELMNLGYDELGPARTRYGITYIKQCKKRIEDLKWIESSKSKSKFIHFNNSQLFGLLKLKEKLSKENAILMPF